MTHFFLLTVFLFVCYSVWYYCERYNRVLLLMHVIKQICTFGTIVCLVVFVLLLSVNLKSLYVQLKAIEKWDGKLPTTQGGTITPFIQVK